MFGFGKEKTHDVRLTDKQVKELTKNMTRKELKEFNRRQKQAADDRFWDAVMFAEIMSDD